MVLILKQLMRFVYIMFGIFTFCLVFWVRLNCKFASWDLEPNFKKRLWHSCFAVNFAKFLRTPFFIEQLFYLDIVLSIVCYRKRSKVIDRYLKYSVNRFQQPKTSNTKKVYFTTLCREKITKITHFALYQCGRPPIQWSTEELQTS